MKKILISMFVAIVCCLTAGADDLVTLVLTVDPPMHCENCENKIKKNIRFEKGVKEIVPSASDQIVTIKYDPAKTNEENLINAFDKIGYKATVAPEGASTKKSGICSGSCTGSSTTSSCCGGK